ncbi:hypothetical protein PLESTB_001359400 [Pleodorina starrii]|uniref:Uncharacterized protein n=1 Tax=Pleodorina starrii TaxID=330485 RepID=A0A9W6F7E2_9CHLO|nr:hypothetical protein PLESTB_001359400 [Pleodorina starrii]
MPCTEQGAVSQQRNQKPPQPAADNRRKTHSAQQRSMGRERERRVRQPPTDRQTDRDSNQPNNRPAISRQHVTSVVTARPPARNQGTNQRTPPLPIAYGGRGLTRQPDGLPPPPSPRRLRRLRPARAWLAASPIVRLKEM